MPKFYKGFPELLETPLQVMCYCVLWVYMYDYNAENYTFFYVFRAVWNMDAGFMLIAGSY